MRATALLALGWPGGQTPRAGALVAHMLDCMEFSLAEDVIHGGMRLPGAAGAVAPAPVDEGAEAAVTAAAAVADYLEALEEAMDAQEQWRAGALGGA